MFPVKIDALNISQSLLFVILSANHREGPIPNPLYYYVKYDKIIQK